MGEVTVICNGRTYRLECGDGEEAHLTALADHVNRHVETIRAAFGQSVDDRVVLMAALMVADELAEAHRHAGELNERISQAKRDNAAGEAFRRGDRAELANLLSRAADRVEALNESLLRHSRAEVEEAD